MRYLNLTEWLLDNPAGRCKETTIANIVVSRQVDSTFLRERRVAQEEGTRSFINKTLGGRRKNFKRATGG